MQPKGGPVRRTLSSNRGLFKEMNKGFAKILVANPPLWPKRQGRLSLVSRLLSRSSCLCEQRVQEASQDTPPCLAGLTHQVF